MYSYWENVNFKQIKLAQNQNLECLRDTWLLFQPRHLPMLKTLKTVSNLIVVPLRITINLLNLIEKSSGWVVYGSYKYDGLFTKGENYQGRPVYTDNSGNTVIYWNLDYWMVGDKITGKYPIRSNDEYVDLPCPDHLTVKAADIENPEHLPWLSGTLTGWNPNR